MIDTCTNIEEKYTAMNKKINVGILCGGRSCEHEVSVASTRSVLEAVNRDEYNITLIGISKKGQWLTPSGDALRLLQGGTVEKEDNHSVLLDYSDSRKLLASETLKSLSQSIDVLFPILHGPFGEDGTVQGLLELSGIPYVGSGVTGSAVGMDKEMMKRVFRSENLPQVNYTVVTRERWKACPEEVQRSTEEQFTYPVFIKPVNSGSSVGISKIHNAGEFTAGMDEACSFDYRVMIEEEAANCREIEAAVLGNETPESASVIGEIVPHNDFYDYDAKYTEGSTELIIPARISPETRDEIRKMAITAFKTIGAAGLARVDFFVRKDDEAIFLNEINTMPGFTPVSMYPRLWIESGVSYTELIDRLIQYALEYHRTRRNMRVVL